MVILDLDGVLHDINNEGVSVGQRVLGGLGMRAICRRRNGEIVDLGTLGGSASSARGLNGTGTIVGGALTKDDVSHHAFVYQDGLMDDLNDLIPASSECELIQALGINDRGDIVAIGHYRGVDRVVLLRRKE